MIDRITRSSEFQEVLASRPCARSSHFSLHHLAIAGEAELSTSPAAASQPAVDHSSASPSGNVRVVRLGIVVPKRHARRAVTRSLVKRQVRCAFDRHAVTLSEGRWIVRLTAPLQGPEATAASKALRRAVGGELDALLARHAMSRR